MRERCTTNEQSGLTIGLISPVGEDIFHVSEVDGVSYLLDPAMVLSSSADLIVAVAEELSCLVVGAGGETVSGTFWLTAAEGPTLRRVYFNVVSTMTQPFMLGAALPSELTVDWTDIDGAGILARLEDLGLAREVIEDGSPQPGRRLRWQGTDLPEPGRLSAELDQHMASHRRPHAGNWMSNTTVQVRDDGFDLVRSPTAKPLGGRVRTLFKRAR